MGECMPLVLRMDGSSYARITSSTKQGRITCAADLENVKIVLCGPNIQRKGDLT